MSMDIQGGHVGCPWTYRGVIWDVHGHTGGSSGVSMDIQGGHLGVHGHTGGSSGMSMDIQGFIWVVKGKGPKAPPMARIWYKYSAVQCIAVQFSGV